jgi:DNA polymerase III delta prime subunit
MLCDMKEPLWVERYRPQKVEDCILPKAVKTQFLDIVKSGRIPNLLLSGGPGTGKTTVSKALCSELGLDWIIINCSDDTGIDVLRTKIKDFASTVSFSDAGKCIVLDEFDYASPNLQAGLRNAMEAFSKTCSFILTCNYPNRIIPALFSRSVHVAFDIPPKEQPVLQAQFFKRVCSVLANENIPFDQKAVVALIQRFFPDNRRVLGQLQQYARAGEIDAGILMELQEVSIENLIKAMKSKTFKDVRQWCAENSGNDLGNLYTKLYKSLKDNVQSKSIPEAILILEDYQRYDSTVPDKELHIVAMCVSMMMNLEFV